jgi:hypothetical protein
MKKNILLLMLLTSIVSTNKTNVKEINFFDAGESNAYDAGISEAFQSKVGNDKLKIGSLATADVNKPKLTEQIKAQLNKGVGKTKEIAASAKSKISSGVSRSKDFFARNYDKAKIKTQSLWERVKSWFNRNQATQVKA